MTVFQWILLNFPTPLLCAAVIIVAVLFAIAGTALVRRFTSPEELRLHNNVTGYMFGAVGVIYAVLLAFTVIVVWGDFNTAAAVARREASGLGSVYRDALALRQPEQDRLRALLREYGKQIVLDEWPAMARGGEGARAQQAQEEIWAMVAAFDPKTKREEIFFNQALERFNEISELRRQRLRSAQDSVNGTVWFVLMVGGFVTSCFPFFFGIENAKLQVIMTSALTILIGLSLFLIFEFQYPFTGDLSLEPDALRNLHMLKGLV